MISHIVQDNSKINELSDNAIVRKLANKDLSVLDKENFIIFPQQLTDSDDLDKDNYIFQKRNDETRTCNVVGIISDGENEIKINSRFTKKENEDYFLRYMVQRVLNYNVVDSKLGSSKEMSYYDLLVFLFPYYLNEALIKGVYKEYVHRQYNDANIKGPIDVARHIKNNIPFMGQIAYRTSEFNYDNNITELIRHTIEKIQLRQDFLLVGNEETKENVKLIKRITPDYNSSDRVDVIQNNILNPVKSGYFEEYVTLQRLCIQILTEEKTGFGDDDQVNGVIIDVAWLWEEYIWKVTNWDHYGRGIKSMKLFSDRSYHRYPDFVFDNIPIDTKYKINIDTRNDFNQLVTYMHIMNSTMGVFLQPSNDKNKSGFYKIGTFKGMGGELFTFKFYIPSSNQDYNEFVEQIHDTELNFVKCCWLECF